MPQKYSKKLAFPTKIIKCFLAPDSLFNSVKSENSLKPAFVYHAALSFLFLLLNAAYFFATGSSVISWLFSFFGQFAAFGFAGIFAALLLLLIVLNFALAVVYHVFVKLLGGKGGFDATYKAVSYAATPSALFGWIPVLGLLITLHYFYLNVKGIAVLHEISPRRAFWALFLPVIIALMLLSVFFVTLLTQIIGSAQAGFL